MKTLLGSTAFSMVLSLLLSASAFPQELNKQQTDIPPVAVSAADTGLGAQAADLGESFSASDGSSEYIVNCQWTVYQQCLVGTYLSITLYRDNVAIFSHTYAPTGYGTGWSHGYADYVGPGKSHTYKLERHTTGTWCDDWWRPTDAGSTKALQPPVNLSVTNPTNSDKTINMSWSNGSELTTYYRVYEGGTQIATTTATSFTVNTTPGKTASWGVATYSSMYNVTSTSVQASMSTAAFKRPENFFASLDTTVGYVRLGWTCASDYATHFQIFRNNLLLATVPVGQKEYLDYSATPGIIYQYYVKSYNNSSGALSAQSDVRDGCAVYLSASDGMPEGKVYLHWTNFPPNFETDLNLYRDGVSVEGVFGNQNDKNDELAAPGRIHKYVLEVLRGTQVILSVSDHGFAPADGSVKGFVTTPTQSGGVKNVEMRVSPTSGTLNKSLTFDGVNDYASAPPLNLNSNAVTLTAWVKRNGAQNDWTGLVFSRAGNTAAGLSLLSTGELRYSWNNASFTWSSGLIVPNGIWTFVALVVEPAKATLYVNDQSAVNVAAHGSEEFDGPLEIGRDDSAATRYFNGMINEVCVWNAAKTPEQIAQERHHIKLGGETGLAAYWRLDRSGVAGDYATNGNHHGTVYGDPVLADDAPPVWHYGLTTTTGSYNVAKINWEENSDFTVRPFKEGHGFKGSNFPQDSLVLTFTQIDHAYEAINFFDTTSIEISGTVNLCTNPPYPMPGVKVLVNGSASGESTDSSGRFSTSVSQAGRYTIAMEYLNHGFVPPDTLLDLQDPVTDLVFVDTTMRTLSGRLVGGCNNVLGVATVRVRSLAVGFVDTTVQSDGSGVYSVRLPAQKYTAQLVSVANPDSAAIISYFTVDTLDISQRDTVHEYAYHSPPIVRISDLPPSGCGEYDVPIVEQERTYAVRIDVVEKYGPLECPAAAGTVTIMDFVAYENPDSSIDLINGRAYYPLIPGYPNLSGGGSHPHQKQMIVQTVVDKYTRFDTVWVFIRGHKPREFQFSTVSPQIPLMILRDPPGDMSYSYLSTTASASVSIGFSAELEAAVGIFGRLKVGGGAEIPGQGATGAWVGGQVEAKAGFRSTISGSQEVKITANQTLKTSDSDKIIGARGDVFMGAALNIVYALTDIVDYDTSTCTVLLDTGVVWNGDGFKTTYLYTESHIRNSVVPGLQALADVLLSSGIPSRVDSAQIVLNQISVWQQVLDRNDSLKANAIHLEQFPHNISFSGLTSINDHASITSTTSISIGLNLFLAVETATEAGFKSGEFIEIAGGVKTFVKLDIGITAGATFEVENTVGFELADDDADMLGGDSFTVDILGDPTYCTPVFRLLGGTSSCPWEPGTLPREGVGLAMNTHVASGVPPELPAQFDLYLYNLTQTNETRTYKLSLVQGSNPDGAIISVGGAVLGDDELQFSLPPNLQNPQRATLRVSRAAGSVFDYEEMMLHLYSPCDMQFDTSVSFSVHFVKPCTDVRIAQPTLNWIANSSHAGLLTVVLKGYDASDASLQQLTCEYRPIGTTDWTLLFSFLTPQLPADSIVYVWNMSALSEGAYELRASTHCALGTFSSRSHIGVYDHTAPAAFGSPQPSDGSLDPGDDIKIRFTEIVDAATANATNVILRNVSLGRDIPITITCVGDELVIAPKVKEDLILGDRIRVTIAGVADPYGNVIDQPIAWEFIVNRISLVKDESKPIPTEFALEQCYPNPFNPSTNIGFGIPREAEAVLRVYDLKGREIACLFRGLLSAGFYEVSFDGKNLSSGIYLYLLEAGDFRSVRKMVLIK